MMGVQFKIAPPIYIDVHWRYAKLGLAYNAIDSSGLGVYEWDSENGQAVIAAQGGGRWRIGNSFYRNLGGMVGIASMLKKESWKINNPSVTTKNDPKTFFFGGIDLSLGWEIGRGK